MNEETIFGAALERRIPAERAAFLDQVCGNDAVLRARVESLLQAHDRAGSFLEKPAVELSSTEATQTLAAHSEAPAGAEGEGKAQEEEFLDFLHPCAKPERIGQLGRYEVMEVLGKGGFGIVLRAFDPRLNRIVAIKVLAPEVAVNGTARKRFLREAQAAAAISHDHVVTIHEIEETSKPPYIVMECIVGQSLEQRIKAQGPLELLEVLRIGRQVASALAAAHAQGLIHRDIKPANILLENGVQRVKITDFGLARAADDASLTQSGVVAGTPQYMSPEQAQGETLDFRSDLFSLGSVLYAMCTGLAPFRAPSNLATLKRVVEDNPRPIREINPDLPDWLVAIINQLMAKEPGHRFQSAQEVTDRLGQHLANPRHPSMTARPEPPAVKAPHQDSVLPQAPQPSDRSRSELPTAGFDAVRRRMSILLPLLGILWPGIVTTVLTLLLADPTFRLRTRWTFDAVLGVWCAGTALIGLGLLVVSRPAGRRFGWLQLLAAGGVALSWWILYSVLRLDRDDVWRMLSIYCAIAPVFGVEAVAWEVRPAGRPWPFRWSATIIPALLIAAVGLAGTVVSGDFPPAGPLAIVVAMVPAAICVVRWYPMPLGWAALLAFPLFYFPFLPAETRAWGHPILCTAIAGANLVLAGVLAWRLRVADPGANPWPSMPIPKPRRWFAVVAVLAVLLAAFGLAELIGISRITSTVMRTFRPDGTLVIESPDEHVTIAVSRLLPDGEPPERIITNHVYEGNSREKMGRFRLKLPPGQYNVEVMHAGEIFHIHVFAIKSLEEVSLRLPRRKAFKEAELPQAPAALPFVILAKDAKAEQKVATLSDAVEAARSGDTIEIRGDGPFVTPALILNRALAIRAAKGFRPVIQLDDAGIRTGASLLVTRAALTLEGLELHRVGSRQPIPGDLVALLLQAEDAPLQVSNCRFVHLVEGHQAGWVALWALRCPTLWLNNCQFVQKEEHSVIKWEGNSGEKALISNCVVSSSLDIVYRKGPAPASLTLERNSFATGNPLLISLYGRPDPSKIKKDSLIQLRSVHNLFGGPLTFAQQKDSIPKEGPLAADDAARLLQQLVRWEEKRNLFGISPSSSFLRLTAQSVPQKPTREVLSVADWQGFWRLDAVDSLQGLPKFEGGNVYSRGRVQPADLLPMDYRLAPEGPGKGAGAGGKDLGADVDLVGPGAAYERWKQTPEYQEWRKKAVEN